MLLSIRRNTPVSLWSPRVHEGQERDPHHQVYGGRRRNYVGQNYRARGYWVSTVGRMRGQCVRYIQTQEKKIRMEQLEMTATLWVPHDSN